MPCERAVIIVLVSSRKTEFHAIVLVRVEYVSMRIRFGGKDKYPHVLFVFGRSNQLLFEPSNYKHEMGMNSIHKLF